MSLPVFGFVSVHLAPLADGVACEADWLARCAASGRAQAHLWCADVGLVAPRRYSLLPGWPAALAAQPAGTVQLRASGGGLVPQGPGLWNLSLLWTTPAAQPTGTGAIYAALCSELRMALARLGVTATPQTVPGSFCDGRYNLAVNGRKLVGTAQAWRRVAGRPLVLAHAVIVIDADPAELTARANAFETALGCAAPYRADALTCLAREAPDSGDIEARTLRALAEQFARVIPPRVHLETTDGPA